MLQALIDVIGRPPIRCEALAIMVTLAALIIATLVWLRRH
jgi:hypothetical protein